MEQAEIAIRESTYEKIISVLQACKRIFEALEAADHRMKIKNLQVVNEIFEELKK